MPDEWQHLAAIPDFLHLSPIARAGRCGPAKRFERKEINVARQSKGAGRTSGVGAFYWILGVVALAGVGAIVWALFNARTGDAATERVDLEGMDDPQALVAKATGVELGGPAPVKVIEFGDYQCPGCGYFALQVKSRLREEFVESGQVQFVWYDFPLPGHRHAFLAARAARCAEAQDRFWDYHDLVFARQNDWSFVQNAIGKFIDYAAELGLDQGEFEACLRSDRFADVVTANAMLGEQLGVNSTPTVFVNSRRVVDFRGYEDLKALIEQELGR